MIFMDKVMCRECRQCNHKGKPSVMRHSTYCNTHYKYRVSETKKSLFKWFTDVKNKFFDKRAKYDEEGNIEDVDTKGFRKSWFWR